MEDYPRDLAEFERRFATEEACRAYLAQLRWPEGFRCPKCGGRKTWPVGRVLVECAACGRQTSVTAGTILQDTRTPLALIEYRYDVPFKFTGTINKVTFNLGEEKLTAEEQEIVHKALAQARDEL